MTLPILYLQLSITSVLKYKSMGEFSLHSPNNLYLGTDGVLIFQDVVECVFDICGNNTEPALRFISCCLDDCGLVQV